MKRMAALLALALGTAMLMSAQDKSKGTEMTGMICDQKCVKQDAGKAACDASCTEKSGDAVFVDANTFVYHFAPDPLLGASCSHFPCGFAATTCM